MYSFPPHSMYTHARFEISLVPHNRVHTGTHHHSTPITAHPHTHTTQVGKIIGQKWRELSEEEKQPFNDEYEADKARYNEQLKAYRNSVAYRRWQEAKQQGQ